MRKLAQVLVIVTMLLSTGNAPAQRPDFRRGSDGDRQGGGPSREGYRGPGGPGGDYRGRGESPYSRGYGRPGGESGEGYRGRGGPMPGGGPGGYRGSSSGYRGSSSGYRGSGSSSRGPSPGSSGASSSSNDERAARLAGFLSGFDTNKNGTIEPSEVPEERRRMLDMMLSRAGIESKGPIRISDLAKRMTGGDSSKSSSKTSSSKSEPERLVPGFGVEAEAEEESSTVLAFGQRDPSASSGASGRSSSSPSRSGRSSSSRSSSGSDRNDADARIMGFAQSMLKRYDRNHSGKLEKDEWGSLRGDPKQIDRDHNGVITVDELAGQLKNYSRGRSEGRGSDDSRSARSGSDNSDRPASYRFRTSLERLPEGLPDWFARSDANADGQVAMAEYSSYWDDAKVREFLKFDLNDDGLITPQECLGAEDAPISPALPQAPPSTGQPSAPATPGSRPTPSPPPSGGQPASGDKPWWMS